MNYDLIPVLTVGLNLDNIFAKTRVIGTVMRLETSRKTENWETKTEMALQYETSSSLNDWHSNIRKWIKACNLLVHKESEINSLCCKYSNFVVAFRTLQVYLGHKCGLVQYTVSSCCYLTRSRQTQNAYCHSECSRMSAGLTCHELQWTVVTIHNSGSNIQELLSVCTACMFLRINIDCFPMQLSLNDLCNGDAVFSLM
jgi:hypothetical protein